MAKDKKGSKAAAAPVKVSKPVEKTVKAGRVTKEDTKKASKEVAKKTAEKVSKKNKKKEPTPDPSSEEDEDTSDESASEEEVVEKLEPKVNGSAKAGASKKDDSDEDSEDSESSEEEPARKVNGKVNGKANGAAVKATPKPVSKPAESDSDEEMDSDSEEAAPVKANGAAAATKDDDSEDSEDSDEDSEADSNDSEDSKDDEEEKPKAAEPASKKRKAEAAVEATPKKAKTNEKIEVNGEMKDPTANLFVGGLSWNIDEDWLTREFEEFGELSGVRIITDRDTGKSKGFGYVEFADVANAITALQTKTNTEIDGRTVRIDFSNPRQPREAGATPQQRGADRAQQYGDSTKEPTATLWVGNLSFDADESTVTEYFQEHGSIKGVRLPTDRETGNPKGFGYVEMSSIDEAKAAFEALQGADIGGRPVRLDYAGERADNGGGGRGGFGDRGGRGGGRGRGGFGDRGGRGGGRGFGGGRGGGRGGFGDRGGRGGGRGGTTNRGGFGDFSGKKVTF